MQFNRTNEPIRLFEVFSAAQKPAPVLAPVPRINSGPEISTLTSSSVILSLPTPKSSIRQPTTNKPSNNSTSNRTTSNSTDNSTISSNTTNILNQEKKEKNPVMLHFCAGLGLELERLELLLPVLSGDWGWGLSIGADELSGRGACIHESLLGGLEFAVQVLL